MGPPSAPRRPNTHGIEKQGKRPGDPPGPPRPGSKHGGPGDLDTRQEARLVPGDQPPTREEDKLASSGWKLLEDLCAMKLEAPKEGGGGKAVSPFPLSLKRWVDSPAPSEKNTWMRRGHVAS